MNNKCCRIVNENSDRPIGDDPLYLYRFGEWLWNRTYNNLDNGHTPPRGHAGWMPIIIRGYEENVAIRPLAPPKNTGLVTFDPLNCTNDQFITDPTRVADPKSASIDCQYCEDFGNAVGSPRGISQLGDAKNNKVNTGNYTCCNGNCDVRTNQIDVDHNIPYVLPQYVDQWGDDKYELKWPDVYKGLSIEWAAYQGRKCAWELLPTMGEIPYDASTSQYNNKRDHELAIEKANIANRMAGNFIVFKIGPKAQSYDDSDEAIEWYKDQIRPCLGEFGYISNRFKDTIDVDLPTPEEFTAPYGFNDGTQDNVFIGRKKRTSWWKWDIEEAPVAWCLRQDKDTVLGTVNYVTEEVFSEELGRTEERITPQWDHQYWIPPGDIWVAKIEPDEPRNTMRDGKTEQDGQQRCPSGVKFMESGNMYVLPHDSYAVYISCNMYERFYDAYQSIKEIPTIRPEERIWQAMYAATHPLIDKVTVDLHKPYTINTEIKEYFSPVDDTATPVSSERTQLGNFANPYYQFMNWFDKKYMTSSNLNLIDSDTDLWNTLVSKYGSFYDSYPSQFIKDITFDNQTLPANTHLGVDLVYDFLVESESELIQGRRNQPDVPNYQNMTNAGINSTFQVGGYRGASIEINSHFIERNKLIPANLEEDGVCHKLSNPALFSDWRAFNDSVYRSEYLQSGWLSYETYYIRNGNGTNNPETYCRECDEYSSYANYATSKCTEVQNCFCDEERAVDAGPCSGQAKNIEDWTIRDTRYYPVINDPKATPISVAFHANGGIFYRGASDSGIVRFGDQNSNIGERKFRITLEMESFGTDAGRTSPLGLRVYACDLYALQSSSPETYLCQRFPIVGQLQTPTINTDNEWPIQTSPAQGGRWETQPAYLPGLSTKYAPSLKKYGGFNKKEIEEMFPYGYEQMEDYEKEDKVVKETVYNYDSNKPFGCGSSDSMTFKNYVETNYDLEIQTARGLMDHTISISEGGTFTGSRTKEDPFEPLDVVVNEDYKRFKTYVQYGRSSLKDENGYLLSADSDGVAWDGGGNWTLDWIPENSKGNTYNLSVRLANPYLSKLLDTVGHEGNRKYYPPASNPRAWYDNLDYLGGTYGYCDNPDQWYDYGDQTSRVTVVVRATPKPVTAKFAMFPPSPVECFDRVQFTKDGQVKPTDDKGVIPTSYKNQLRRSAGRSLLPKLTFNNIVDWDSGPLPYDLSESFLINEKQSKSLSSLFRKVKNFTENRKFKIVLATRDGKFFQLDGLPTRYESQKKTYEGFGHFVQVVRDGSDYNTYLPGAIPLVQKKTLEDVTWVTKPNTRFTAKINNTLENFDPNWPLNLRLTTGYRIDPVNNTLTFAGTRMFFALFPKVEIITLPSPSDDMENNPPVGSIVNFLRGPVGTYYKYADADEAPFSSKYVVFNPNDYTWQRYSDLHYDFNNTSYIGYVYNSILKINPITFYFYRDPLGDRTKQAEAICTEMRLKSYLVDARGKRVFPGTLNDPCIDLCTDGGITFIRTETELKFKNNLNVDWYEIDDLKTEILSSHIYKPECVNNEKDSFLSNRKYRSKWSDLKGFDGIILDHSEEEQYASKYYPPTRYDNVFYKMLVDNDNQSEIPTSRGEERHHSIVPYGNKGSAPFRFNIHQKYNVDYGNDLVNSAEISGVHNYFPFMDINDKDWGLGYTPVDKFFVPEVIEQDFDGLVEPNLTEVKQGALGEYQRTRPDKQIILTIPADATFTQTIEFATKADTYVISDTLRADTPLFYLGEIEQEDTENCPGDLDILKPDPYQGRNYGKNFGGTLDIGRPYDIRKGTMPLENWKPKSAFARWTRYCDIDEETCETQKCITSGRGSTELYGVYKMSNPTKLTYRELAGQDFLAFISYNAGIVNGMNGVRPPKILRSIHSKQENPAIKNDILYSKDNTDLCNDRVVLPPEYQYPDWDTQVNSTFLQGVKDLEKLSLTYEPAEQLIKSDLLAEEMVFRALYGEKEFVNRTSFNGDTLLTADQILNYVDPQIDVDEMHKQILWSYDRGSNSDVSRVQTQHTFGVNSRLRVGDRASVTWGGVKVEADITENSTNTWEGRVLNLTIESSQGTQNYSVPIFMSNVVFSDMINVLAGGEAPTVDDNSTITLVEQGAIVQPERKTRVVDCYNGQCCFDLEDNLGIGGGDYQKILLTECKNMGTWKYFLLQVPRLQRYNWNDTFNVCEPDNFIYGPDTSACKPYKYGYCNLTPEECPPCTGEHPPEELVLVESLDKDYYVTENKWINNYLDTDVERFTYDYKSCRNTIRSNGHLYRHNYEYAEQKFFRFDLAAEFNAAEYRLAIANIDCFNCGGGGCHCSDPGTANRPGTCVGVCDYQLEVTSNDEGPCNTKCKYSEPRVSLGSECFCNGAPACPNGSDPDGCYPYGSSACPIRFSHPTTLTPNEACDKAFALVQYDTSYWGYYGYDSAGQPRGCGRACYPRGDCDTTYFCFIQDCEKCPQSNMGAAECYDSPPGPPVWNSEGYTWGRTVVAPYISSCGIRGQGFTATPSNGTTCSSDNCPDYSQTDVFETKTVWEYSEPEVAYDTYLKDTKYGGGNNRICNSGSQPDCVTTLFSVTLDNDQVRVNFPSGDIAWASQGGIGSNACVGPSLETTNVSLCTDTNYRISESNSNLEVNISDNLGYISNYSKTDTVGCTNNVKINMPPQSQEWAVRDIDGQCMVGHWMGQHINESLVISQGQNAYVVCQSDQIAGSACVGRLEIANAGSTFNSPPGGECPEEKAEARVYGVCEGTLSGPDCNSPDECSWGESSWFEELEVLHNEYRKRYNNANRSIPTENIIEGLIPGSVGPLLTKTYQIPEGTVTRANKGPYGVTTEDMYAYVTVAYYDYKYRAPHNLDDTITETRQAQVAEQNGTDSVTASCYKGRPFTNDPALQTLDPLRGYFYHCNESNTGDCGEGIGFPWYIRGSWTFMPSRLAYRCINRGVAYPNWYTPAVSPHGCRPQFDERYGRYDTPPTNFMSTTPTVERKACQGTYSCYYNDKQWPAGENDYYGLAGQGTFLQCHKFLGKFWVYDYFNESPI